jgi:hypothetical protein
MSLEQALADNTAALQAMTAALLKGGTAVPAADKPAKGSGEKAGKAAAYEAKHSKEEMQAAMQELKEKCGMDAAKKVRAEVAKVDKLAEVTDPKVIDAVYDAAKAAIKAAEEDEGM